MGMVFIMGVGVEKTMVGWLPVRRFAPSRCYCYKKLETVRATLHGEKEGIVYDTCVTFPLHRQLGGTYRY